MDDIKKIYIAGCGGMLGHAFYSVFSKEFNLKCSDKIVDEKWLELLDFTDFVKYEKDVTQFNADLLIHLGAITDLEECELNPSKTYESNLKSVEYAVQISNRLKIPIIFISTAGIFDGQKDTYSDDDLPNPLSHYGKSKFMAEQYIEKHSENYLICRAGWMMGGGYKKDKKFVKKIILQLMQGKKELNIVNDKNGTPTYTFDFAKQVLLLIKKQKRGKFNMVCEGLSSRLDVTLEILKFFKLENKIKIKEVSSSFFKNEYYANRPYSERLINKKLNDYSLNIMRNWKICLNEYLTEYYNNILK